MQKVNELRAKWALAGGLDMELNSTKKEEEEEQQERQEESTRRGFVGRYEERRRRCCQVTSMFTYKIKKEKDDAECSHLGHHRKLGQLTRS